MAFFTECSETIRKYTRGFMENLIRSQLYLTNDYYTKAPPKYTLEKLCSTYAPAKSIWAEAPVPGESRDVPIVVLHGHTRSPPFVMIFSHANGENLETTVQLGDRFRTELKCDVIAYEYTGYGPKDMLRDTIPTEHALYADATAVALAVRKMYPHIPIVSFGRSLGCALAVQVASQLKEDCAGLILLSPFTSVLGTQLSGVFLNIMHPLDLFPVLEKIEDASERGVHANVPLLVMHGDKDQVVPCSLGKQVNEAAGRHLKSNKFVMIEGADHNSTIGKDFEKTMDIIVHFFQSNRLIGNHVYD